MLSKHLLLLRARNKRDIALKADAEAAMEKLAAGLKKQKVVCVTNSSKRKKTSCSW
jgi:hypothetical protein